MHLPCAGLQMLACMLLGWACACFRLVDAEQLSRQLNDFAVKVGARSRHLFVTMHTRQCQGACHKKPSARSLWQNRSQNPHMS
jgi:hypothetical protein